MAPTTVRGLGGLLVLAMMVAISAHSARAGITEDYLTTDAVLGDLLDYNTSVSINFGDRTPVSKVLFGIFFEEIGHAGDGGIYAEMVQDRSFDAIARASGFDHSTTGSLSVNLRELVFLKRNATQPLYNSSSKFRSKDDFLRQRKQQPESNNEIIAWQPVGGASTALTRAHPLNQHNTVAMKIVSGSGEDAGIQNTGYWGMHVQAESTYTLSVYLLNPEDSAKEVRVSLASQDGGTLYATASISNVTGKGWQRRSVDLLSCATVYDAVLRVTFSGPGTLLLDSVSLFPAENVARGEQEGHMNPWPFRADLLQALKDLSPRFLRFPGGCYIEGDWLRNAFLWKKAVGRAEERPGHWNGVWSYWSTDGLGLFEYMLMAEQLQAEPIWVINNGIAHEESVSGAAIMPFVRDALDSLEFIMGPPTSTWGGLRAAMGHPQPWNISYISIGNEGCGLPWDPPIYKPYYLNNYLAFFGAIKASYPHMRLIASCDMGRDAPTDLWEYHVYTNPDDMFGRRHVFDSMSPAANHYVFASEYAVTDGGGGGNLLGAVAEAGFMTGLERNSRLVQAASYAPLFVNADSRPWPTNLIVFDNHRWFGIPSYYVQQLFAQHQGTQYLATSVAAPPGQVGGAEERVAASATCQDDSCLALSVKVVNMAPFQQSVRVQLAGELPGCVRPLGTRHLLTSPSPQDENSMDQPTKVSTRSTPMRGLSSAFVLPVPAFSVNVVSLELKPGGAGMVQGVTPQPMPGCEGGWDSERGSS